MPTPRSSQPSRGFTLIEILIVILIIVLVSAATLPVVLPALAHRELGDSARLLQATLAGTHDLAIRSRSARGLRFLPDEQFNGATPATPLASSRMIAIESAPNHSEGFVNLYNPKPLVVPISLSDYIDFQYSSSPWDKPWEDPRLIIIEEKWAKPPPNPIPNPPTSWYWNIRQGDKIRIESSGPYFTIVGPMRVGVRANPERFINNGLPTPANPIAGPAARPEFLFVVNGEDDDGNGYTDDSFDGLDNDPVNGFYDPGFNGLDDGASGNIDDLVELLQLDSEFITEQEQFRLVGLTDTSPLLGKSYTIYRRPIPSPGAREVTLSPGVVIDLTTSLGKVINPTNGNWVRVAPERSRLPVDPETGIVEILFYTNGQVLPSTPYGNAVDPFGKNPDLDNLPPFYHFWLSERQDVYEPTLPTPPTPPYRPSLLPLPRGVPGPDTRVLRGEAKLVTLNPRTGQAITTTISDASFLDPATSAYEVNAPYRQAQQNKREAP